MRLSRFLPVLLISAPTITAAAPGQIHVGVLAHDVPDLWSHHNREDGVDLNLEWTPDWPKVPVPGGAIRSHIGMVLNSASDTSYLYAGFNWRVGGERGWYTRVGLGAAYHNGERHLVSNDRKALGSDVLFHIPLELGYQWKRHSLSLYFAHVSNAYTQDENEGMDVLGLRAGWRY